MTNKLVENKMSKRLKMISSSVIECNQVYDIGTDHAYVPIDLLQKNKCDIAYATDIKEGPLKRANKNIKKYKLEDKIHTKLADGLNKVKRDTQCIIISGMGGILISQMIEKNIDIAKSTNQLIVQAMNAEEILRKYLITNGFNIEFEKLCQEDNKVYNLISCKFEKKTTEYKEYEYYCSKYLVDENNIYLKKYLKPKIKRLGDIIKGQIITNNINKEKIEIKRKLEEIVNEGT